MLIKPSLSLFLCTAAFIDGERALSGFTKAHTLTTVSTEESSETALILLHASRAYSQANNIQAKRKVTKLPTSKPSKKPTCQTHCASYKCLPDEARFRTRFLPRRLPHRPSRPRRRSRTLRHRRRRAHHGEADNCEPDHSQPEHGKSHDVSPSSASPSTASPSHTRAGLNGKPGHVWEQLSSSAHLLVAG